MQTPPVAITPAAEQGQGGGKAVWPEVTKRPGFSRNKRTTRRWKAANITGSNGDTYNRNAKAAARSALRIQQAALLSITC